MNINNDYKNRQIIPRWYPYDYAFYFGEIKSKDNPDVCIWTPKAYNLKEKEWLFYKKLPYAIEFVGTALIANDYSNKNAIEASKFILKNSKNISTLAKQVVEKFLQISIFKPNFNLSNQDIYSEISTLKKYIHAYPLNAILWTDMAFYYAVIGQMEKANNSISVALNLASENRFILRSAARFFLHRKDPKKALAFLRSTKYTQYDPWLLASEISISEASNLKTSNIKVARNILERLNERPRDLSELFGTIGTLEANCGKTKKAKKLFKSALEDPNENTIAQAEWISNNIGFSVQRTQNIKAPFEADARLFFRNCEYRKSLKATLEWLRYQPFSSQPAQNATYIAATCLNNFKEVLRIVENEARFILNKDFFVKNNYLFSLASLDKVKNIYRILNTINYGSLKKREQATYKATKGLIKFRTGEIEEGRKLYKEAIKDFNKIESEIGKTLATFYWAREEKRIGNDVTEMVENVRILAKKLGLNELLKSELLFVKK